MSRRVSPRWSSSLAIAILLAACRRGEPPAPSPAAAPAPSPAASPASSKTAAATSCPPEMAPVPGFGCIDRWEASADAGDAGVVSGLGDKAGNGTIVIARSRAGAQPLTNVSVAQAAKACQNTGKHLCGEKEWVAACRGTDHWEYPYGNTFEPKRCNDWNVVPYGPHPAAKTGAYPRCVTPAGVYDMANNVGEWMAEKSHTGDFHEIRGGTFNMTIHDSACDEDDYTAPPDAQRPDVGFRCCR